MSKKMWLLLVATHLVVMVGASGSMYWYVRHHEPMPQYILVYPQDSQSTLPAHKSAQVWELVILPDDMLSGDDQKDFVCAQTCLSAGNWEYVGNGSTNRVPRKLIPAPFRDFTDGKVFVFRFPQKQKALLAQ